MCVCLCVLHVCVCVCVCVCLRVLHACVCVCVCVCVCLCVLHACVLCVLCVCVYAYPSVMSEWRHASCRRTCLWQWTCPCHHLRNYTIPWCTRSCTGPEGGEVSHPRPHTWQQGLERGQSTSRGWSPTMMHGTKQREQVSQWGWPYNLAPTYNKQVSNDF